MSHVIFCPDTTGETGALWFAEEIGGYNTRIYKLGRFIADKVSKADVPTIAAAMRDADEARLRSAGQSS